MFIIEENFNKGIAKFIYEFCNSINSRDPMDFKRSQSKKKEKEVYRRLSFSTTVFITFKCWSVQISFNKTSARPPHRRSSIVPEISFNFMYIYIRNVYIIRANVKGQRLCFFVSFLTLIQFLFPHCIISRWRDGSKEHEEKQKAGDRSWSFSACTSNNETKRDANFLNWKLGIRVGHSPPIGRSWYMHEHKKKGNKGREGKQNSRWRKKSFVPI